MSWRFPNVEKAMVAYLTAETGRRVVTEIPSSKLPANLPLLRITRGPGSDDTITDSFLIDVEALGSTKDSAFDTSEDAREAILALSGRHAGDVLIDYTRTASSPTSLPYSPAVHRYVASYRVHVRGR